MRKETAEINVCVARALPFRVPTTGKLAPADGATTPDSDEGPSCLQERRHHTHAPLRESLSPVRSA